MPIMVHILFPSIFSLIVSLTKKLFLGSFIQLGAYLVHCWSCFLFLFFFFVEWLNGVADSLFKHGSGEVVLLKPRGGSLCRAMYSLWCSCAWSYYLLIVSAVQIVK